MPSLTGFGGPVIWLQCDSRTRLDKFAALSEALLQADERVGVVLCHPADCVAPSEVPRRLSVPLGTATPEVFRKLGQQRRIAAVLLAARSLPADMIAQWSRLGIPVFVVDMAVPRVARGPWSIAPGHRKRVLNKLSQVFPSSDRQRSTWLAAGLPEDRLSTIGTLSQAPLALRCNEAERDALANALRHRTIWFAAGVPQAEEDLIIAVQQEALRESHRLALILHPADPMRGPALQAHVSRYFSTALRSRDDPISAETQVYIADTEGERGLWYRLAVACYLGGSFSEGSSFSPMEAAGLGCAIVHGPEGGRFGDAFDLLAERRATRRLTRPDALGRMLRAVLRPEQAAEMAHRGWQIVSEGAEATETLVAALLGACGKEE